MEAVLRTSKMEEPEAPLENCHLPVAISSWDKEAGPPEPQSREREAKVPLVFKLK